MNTICRLCLTASTALNYELLEIKFLSRVSRYLLVEFLNHNSLPNHICKTCLNILDQFITFREKVKENQDLLFTHLSIGEKSLQHFCLSLSLNGNIKEEIPDKHEEITETCEGLSKAHKQITQKGKEIIQIHEQIIKTHKEITESQQEIKTEVAPDLNDLALEVIYSSDDDLTLSSIKSNKKRKHQKKLRKKEKIKAASDKIPETNDSNTLIVADLKCLTCFELLNSQDTLREHYRLKHQPKDFIDINVIVVKEGVKRFKCSKCGKVYDTKRKVKYHALVTHLGERRPFLCKLCGKTYKDIPSIMLHARAHGAGRLLTCSFKCGYTTRHPSNKRAHEVVHHKKVYKYTCEKCCKGFLVKSWYEEHQNIHSGQKPFVCDICGVAFHCKRYLTKHRSRSHADSALLKRFKCVYCSHPTDTKHALQLHLAKEHGIKSSHLCDICGKTFQRVSHLTEHKRYHSDTKAYTCSICQKSFKNKSHLRRHESRHGGARPRVCSHCGKTYTQGYALNCHIAKYHTVADALKCAKCDKTFATQFSVDKHKKICSVINC